ncbi:MAG: nitroreductase family protein [Actinobacteria bacterium]|nr:nitroreductase family protein [Actinomycetota bacterium]
MQYEELLELVKSRRTIRAIKPDPLPDEMIGKLLEMARWAPTGFNMQPMEFLVVKDLELRKAIKEIVDDYKNSDFFALEATREKWQGSPWTIETHGRWDCPLAPVNILILGDTRRRVGLPMVARYSQQKGDSIFESSLSNAFLYMWLAAHSLGLAAQPVSAVKYPKVLGLVKHLLNLPDFVEIYDIFLIGRSAMEGGPSPKLMRHLDEMTHHDRARDDEFLSEEELRKQIMKLRAGNVARHVEADRVADQLGMAK